MSSSFVIEENDNRARNGKSCFVQFKWMLIFGGGILLVAGVVLAIVLPLTLKKKTDDSNNVTVIYPTTTRVVTTSTTSLTSTSVGPIEKPNSRADCVPWAKTWSASRVEAECKKNARCKYQPVPGNVDVPACFYDTNTTKVKLLSREDSLYGFTARLQLDQSNAASVVVLELDELEESVLRFKVKFRDLAKLLNIYETNF